MSYPYTILHISDLHFGPAYLPTAGEAVLKLCDSLRPDVVVNSGDLTQRAKVEQFEQAAAFLEKLPCENLINVPGNHDVPLYRIFERLSAPYRNYRTHISPELEPVLELGDLLLVGMNTTSPLRKIVGGKVHAASLERCCRLFKAAPAQQCKMLVAHHHFVPAPDYENDGVMRGAGAALELLKAAGCELILGGHLHRSYIGNSLNLFRGENPDRGIIIAQSGTSTSVRGRVRESAKNSLNVVQIGCEDISITHYHFFPGPNAFAPVSVHRFPRPGKRSHLGEQAE